MRFKAYKMSIFTLKSDFGFYDQGFVPSEWVFEHLENDWDCEWEGLGTNNWTLDTSNNCLVTKKEVLNSSY